MDAVKCSAAVQGQVAAVGVRCISPPEHATCDRQHATCNMRHATGSIQHAMCSIQHAACNIQHAAYNMQHATRPRATLTGRLRSGTARPLAGPTPLSSVAVARTGKSFESVAGCFGPSGGPCGPCASRRSTETAASWPRAPRAGASLLAVSASRLAWVFARALTTWASCAFCSSSFRICDSIKENFSMLDPFEVSCARLAA